ncbi:MAG: hypothetical protein ACK5LC_11690, partial [Coprobacillaceae bacterium]
MDFPEYLMKISKDIKETDYLEATLQINGIETFEVWISNAQLGYIEKGKTVFIENGIPKDKNIYILNSYDELPLDKWPTRKIYISLPNEDVKHLVFDETIHGYDNMFCDEHNSEKEDQTNQVVIGKCKLFKAHLKLGMSIDYEEEKEDYDFDDSGLVEV